MNRIVAVLLSIIVLLSVSIITSNATETQVYQTKISAELQSAMERSNENELLSVWIWFTDIDKDEMERQIGIETGLSLSDVAELKKPVYHGEILTIIDALQNPNLSETERQNLVEMKEMYFRTIEEEKNTLNAWYYPYLKDRDRIMTKMYTENNSDILCQLKVSPENIVFIDDSTPSSIVKMNKVDILKATQSDDVILLDKYMMAEPVEPIDDGESFTLEVNIRERMEMWIKTNFYDGELIPEYETFEVLYEHIDQDKDTDWVLIYTDVAFGVELWTGFALISNRVFVGAPTDIFRFGMALYDVNQDEFFDLSTLDDYNKYNDLADAIDHFGKGRLLGDVDSDDEITILDVTIIQRCLAGMREFSNDDLIDPDEEIDSSFHPLTYYSDFNCDGIRDIIDATCIQRYLVGLPYSTGGATTKPTVSLSFEDIDNVYEHNTVTATATGKAPFTYCYTIHGIFHANSEYGDDLGEYHRSEDQFEPGGVFFTTGYIDSNITTIPTHSITYGDPFELIVTVKDANRRESSPVTVTFYNC